MNIEKFCPLPLCTSIGLNRAFQPAPKYHTKGCSRSSAESPGARTQVLTAFESFSNCEFQTSIARTPFCAILWRSPSIAVVFNILCLVSLVVVLRNWVWESWVYQFRSGPYTSDILFPYRSPSPRPHPDPTQHRETDPKRTQNRPETEPKRSQTEPKWTEIKLFGVGRAGGLSGWGGL